MHGVIPPNGNTSNDDSSSNNSSRRPSTGSTSSSDQDNDADSKLESLYEAGFLKGSRHSSPPSSKGNSAKPSPVSSKRVARDSDSKVSNVDTSLASTQVSELIKLYELKQQQMQAALAAQNSTAAVSNVKNVQKAQKIASNLQSLRNLKEVLQNPNDHERTVVEQTVATIATQHASHKHLIQSIPSVQTSASVSNVLQIASPVK